MSIVTESDWLGEPAAPTRKPGGRPRKDGRGRQRKLACERCGFIAYASAGALERCGFPSCACGEPLRLPNLRDRAVVEWDALEQELACLPRVQYNDAMREIGALGMVIAPYKHDGGAVNPRKRCDWEGGYCMVITSGRYCSEHDPHRVAERSRQESRRCA